MMEWLCVCRLTLRLGMLAAVCIQHHTSLVTQFDDAFELAEMCCVDLAPPQVWQFRALHLMMCQRRRMLTAVRHAAWLQLSNVLHAAQLCFCTWN